MDKYTDGQTDNSKPEKFSFLSAQIYIVSFVYLQKCMYTKSWQLVNYLNA